KGRRAHEDIRQIKIRMVKRVEKFRPELEPRRLSQVRILGDGETHVGESRTFENVSARVAETAEFRKHKGRCVEPLLGPGIGTFALRHAVRSIVKAKSQNGAPRVAIVDIRVQGDCKRPSALKGNDLLGAPSAQES